MSEEAGVLAARDRLWLSMRLDPPHRPRLLRVRLVAGDEGEVSPVAVRARGGASVDLAWTTAVLVVPRDALAGLEDTGGELVVRAPDPGVAWDRIELVLTWGGMPRRIALDLRRPCQRDLTWRLRPAPPPPAGARSAWGRR